MFARHLGKPVVIKAATSEADYERLTEQMIKQQESDTYYDRFRAPIIYGQMPEHYSFMMEHLPWETPCNWLVQTPPEQCLWFYEEIAQYFRHIFSTATECVFNAQAYQAKAMQVIENILANPCGQKIKWLGIRMETVRSRILVLAPLLMEEIDFSGWCHGDFTLSNILVDPIDRKIGWIDFLDGWDHSPYIDMAKIIQEYRYQWSFRFNGMTNNPTLTYHDRLEALAGVVREALPEKADHFVLSCYVVINDLRLLQYEKDAIWFETILTHIERAFDAITHSDRWTLETVRGLKT